MGHRWFNAAPSTAATGMAMSGAGTRRVSFGTPTSNASVAAAMISSLTCAVPRACHMAAIRPKKDAGAPPRVRPRTSFSCNVAMTTAMPAVKPLVTGYGMNSMSWPRRATPIAISMRPPISPETSSPARPNLA